MPGIRQSHRTGSTETRSVEGRVQDLQMIVETAFEHSSRAVHCLFTRRDP